MPECIYKTYSYSSWLSPLSRQGRRVISRQSRFILFLLSPDNANYGLILHKHVELIWFYYVSCLLLIKIGSNMVIFTDII